MLNCSGLSGLCIYLQYIYQLFSRKYKINIPLGFLERGGGRTIDILRDSSKLRCLVPSVKVSLNYELS